MLVRGAWQLKQHRVQRDSVVVGVWNGLSLCGWGLLTEAQLEEAEHLHAEALRVPQGGGSWQAEAQWPNSPFSSSTGNNSSLLHRFSSCITQQEAAMGSTSSFDPS